MNPTSMIHVSLYMVCVHLLLVSADCVIKDDPRYSGHFVSCTHSYLNHIPDLPFNIIAVDLSFNSISVVHNGSFSNVTLIKYLDLSHNVLTHLEPEAFQNCHLLQHLDLSDNKLALTSESFPDVVFDPLFDLRWLNIKHNQKGNGTYPERIFQNLGNLSVLSIGAYRGQVFGPGFGCLHNLKELYIGDRDCELHEIRNNTFTEFGKTRLEKLEINFCDTEIMEAGSLVPFRNLTDLTLQFLHLGTKQTFAALSAFENHTMNQIRFRRIKFAAKAIDPERSSLEDRIVLQNVLKPVANVCVRKFQIPENDLLWLHWIYLAENRFGQCVEEIDASSNEFTTNALNMLLALLSFPRFRVADFSVPAMASVNPDIKPKYSIKEKQETVPKREKPVNPCLHTICNISVPQNWSIVNISSITITFGPVIGRYNLLNSQHLVLINMSFLGITEVDALLTGVYNLKILDMSGNTDLYFKNFDFLSNFPNLEELRLSHSSFQQTSLMEKGQGLLKVLSSLKRLYLAYNQLYLIPSNLFDFSSKLELIDLTGNLFNSIPFDIGRLPRLQTLDMSFNTITSLKKYDRDMIDSFSSGFFHLKLKYNLFACGCDSVDFLLWLKETNVHLDNERNYACLEGSEGIINTEDILKDFLKTWRKCTGKSLFYITLVIFTLLVASILGSLLVKTNKTSILYIFLNTLKKQLRKPMRQDFEYDVYVAYAEKDYQWSCLSLCPRLEEMGLKLYIYDRDAVPGDSIPDQIAENISKSWKIILYFSNSYETDQWSYMSMMAAINSVDNLSPERIILLLPEEEHPRLPMCLLEVVPESCIFTVPAGLEAQGIVFRSLVDLVKK